jgi:hypothetical protein
MVRSDMVTTIKTKPRLRIKIFIRKQVVSVTQKPGGIAASRFTN